MENLCTLKENSITQTILDENLKIKLQNKQLDLGKCERWKKQQMPNAAVQNNEMKIFMRARKKQGKTGLVVSSLLCCQPSVCLAAILLLSLGSGPLLFSHIPFPTKLRAGFTSQRARHTTMDLAQDFQLAYATFPHFSVAFFRLGIWL